MVYAPGHFQETAERPRRSRYRSRREQLAVRFAGILTLVLVGVVVFSLTNHQRQTGHGCIDFSYSTMIGGGEMYKCGADARTLCSTPSSKKSIDGDYQTELYAACRKAGIRIGGA